MALFGKKQKKENPYLNAYNNKYSEGAPVDAEFSIPTIEGTKATNTDETSLKKLTNIAKSTIKRTVSNTFDEVTHIPENIVHDFTDKLEMQEYVYNVISKMEHGQDLWNWSSGYWSQHDEKGRVEPLLDRKAYMKKGQSFKKGKIYKMGSMFQGEISIGASVGGLGTVYNLEYLTVPAQYAVAKDKDTVMLFNWH